MDGIVAYPSSHVYFDLSAEHVDPFLSLCQSRRLRYVALCPGVTYTCLDMVPCTTLVLFELQQTRHFCRDVSSV